MKQIIKYFKILCFAAFAGCQPAESPVQPPVRIKFEKAEAIDLGQYVGRVHAIQLENKQESVFSDIDKLVVSGDRIFILDKKLEAVFCFDTTGKFNYRIQRVGRGPGEYKELDAMWIKSSKDELWLQSFWPPLIMVYSQEGELLREIPIRWPARDMTGIGDDLIAGYNSSRSSDGRDSLLEGVFLTNDEGKYKGQPVVAGGSSVYWSLNFQRNLEEYEGGALLLSQSDTIFHIDIQGHSRPEAILDWGRYRYPDRLKKIGFNSSQYREALSEKFVSGKDQLVAFGPVRIFRIILEGRQDLAVADLRTGQGKFSERIDSGTSGIPLLYPLARSDKNELVGIYDLDLLLAFKEARSAREMKGAASGLYQKMDRLVDEAIKNERPVLWFAEIRKEWLNY